MIEHALWLASNGFAVFPLQVRSKEPLTAHGFKDASRDPAQITAWWTAEPRANIGVATGTASGVLVVDIDGAEGEASIQALGPMPETLEVKTGKGRHLYYQHVPGFTIGTSKIGHHVDHRGEGGYVVAPPSVHPSGSIYEWSRVVAPAPLPASVVARLQSNKRTQGPMLAAAPEPALADVDSARESLSLEGHVQAITNAKQGYKHEILVKAAWAHACAAHEAWESREQAEPRILHLLHSALMLNTTSSVDSWHGATKDVTSAFDKAYARPLPVRLEGFERELNEDGLARRFAKMYGAYAVGLGALPSCLFVPGQGWRVWDGRRWAEQPGNGRPTELVSKMLIEVESEILSGGDEKTAKSLRARRGAGFMGSILSLAQRYLSIGFERFDCDPLLLNCLNGTIDLRTGQLRAHSPADLITKCCGVSYDSAAHADGWVKALHMMQHGDAPTVEYLRLLLGSFIQGSPVDGFWLLHGNGFDGKSTILDVMHAVLGTYAQAVNPQIVMVAKNGGKPHTSMMGGLAGARLGTIDEMPSDCQLDTGAIKSYFGRLPVRMQTGMGKDFVDVRPTAKGLAATNHLPRIDENDIGTKRRIAVVPFLGLKTYNVPKDDTFASRLIAQEGPGILAWLVGGCLSWLRSGCQLPGCERVENATLALFGEGDIVGRFLEACPRGSQRCTVAQLYLSFVAFSEAEGDYVCSKRAFGNRVRERDIIPHRGSGGVREYQGISWPVDHPPAKPPKSS